MSVAWKGVQVALLVKVEYTVLTMALLMPWRFPATLVERCITVSLGGVPPVNMCADASLTLQDPCGECQAGLSWWLLSVRRRLAFDGIRWWLLSMGDLHFS